MIPRRPYQPLTDGDLVVIIHANQVAQLQVSSHGRSLGGNALHGATITKDAIGVVVDQVVPRLVELSRGVRLGDGKTNRVRETLTQGTSRDLHSGGIMGFRVARGDAIHLLIEVVSKMKC